MKDYTISISELRENLKEYIDLVKTGTAIYITKRGEIIAEIKKPMLETEDDAQYLQRLAQYKNGGIVLLQDIVNQPLKNEDYVDDQNFISKLNEN